MTYYLLLHDNLLSEIIPDLVEDFPGIPAVERYAPELLGQCVTCASLEGVELNMTYDPESDTFYWPPPTPAPDPVVSPTPAPTELERLTARVDYISIMTGVDV